MRSAKRASHPLEGNVSVVFPVRTCYVTCPYEPHRPSPHLDLRGKPPYVRSNLRSLKSATNNTGRVNLEPCLT